MKYFILIVALLLLGPAARGQEPAPGATQEVQGIPIVWCPPGVFEKGSGLPGREIARLLGGLPEWHADGEGRCRGEIAAGFWIGAHEVTVAQWNAFCEPAHRRETRTEEEGRAPVVNVTMDHVESFLSNLNEAGQGTFSLPSEMEWEYACRAGSPELRPGGDDPAALRETAWYAETVRGTGTETPRAVGQKQPNAWGLYDMLGNVWEWCGTAYTLDPPCGGAVDTGAEALVIRGGSVQSTQDHTHFAARLGWKRSVKSTLIGFRLVWRP